MKFVFSLALFSLAAGHLCSMNEEDVFAARHKQAQESLSIKAKSDVTEECNEFAPTSYLGTDTVPQDLVATLCSVLSLKGIKNLLKTCHYCRATTENGMLQSYVADIVAGIKKEHDDSFCCIIEVFSEQHDAYDPNRGSTSEFRRRMSNSFNCSTIEVPPSR